jgi:hypothetical protein
MIKFNNFIVFLILFSLSLNEFYHEVFGRVLDYFSIVLIIFYFFLRVENRLIYKPYYSLFLYFIPFIIFGLINLKFLPSLAILFGVSFVAIFAKNVSNTCKDFTKILDFVILFHVIAFVIQILFFYAFKIPFSYLDFFPYLQQSRVYNEGLNLLRPGGFMMEPNSYSANIFMLTFISYKLNKKKITVISMLALITIPFTTSLWGISILLILIFFRFNFVFKIVAILLFLLSSTMVYSILDNSIAFERVVRIIEDPLSDNSIVTRLGLESNYSFNLINLIFGNGINSTDFQSFLGGNGISYMLYCFGIVGTLFFLFWVYFSNGFKILLLFLFFHLTYPYYSYLIFWFFLAIVLKNITFHISDKKLLIDTF